MSIEQAAHTPSGVILMPSEQQHTDTRARCSPASRRRGAACRRRQPLCRRPAPAAASPPRREQPAPAATAPAACAAAPKTTAGQHPAVHRRLWACIFRQLPAGFDLHGHSMPQRRSSSATATPKHGIQSVDGIITHQSVCQSVDASTSESVNQQRNEAAPWRAAASSAPPRSAAAPATAMGRRVAAARAAGASTALVFAGSRRRRQPAPAASCGCANTRLCVLRHPRHASAAAPCTSWLLLRRGTTSTSAQRHTTSDHGATGLVSAPLIDTSDSVVCVVTVLGSDTILTS
jgi:hypothetical protein